MSNRSSKDIDGMPDALKFPANCQRSYSKGHRVASLPWSSKYFARTGLRSNQSDGGGPRYMIIVARLSSSQSLPNRCSSKSSSQAFERLAHVIVDVDRRVKTDQNPETPDVDLAVPSHFHNYLRCPVRHRLDGLVVIVLTEYAGTKITQDGECHLVESKLHRSTGVDCPGVVNDFLRARCRSLRCDQVSDDLLVWNCAKDVVRLNICEIVRAKFECSM